MDNFIWSVDHERCYNLGMIKMLVIEKRGERYEVIATYLASGAYAPTIASFKERDQALQFVSRITGVSWVVVPADDDE